jgi:peptide/nickel transport system substrate-binding protein
MRVEPAGLARNPPKQNQTTLDMLQRLFNAELSIMDDTGATRPFLAAELPRLNTDSWRVFPDGQMETTYKLRPGLTWHDGQPLTAEDFAFGWRVIANPELGQASLIPQRLMTEVSAPDPLTVVIRWAQPFPDAGTLNLTFSPLPVHILRPAYEQGNLDAFTAHPYWRAAFVGLGPFSLTNWELGAYIDAEAFPEFVLGRPKIDRVQVTWVSDPNAALTRLLSGDTDILTDSSIKSQQLPLLKQDWIAQGKGDVVVQPVSYRAAFFQLRPDTAAPTSFLDARVRKALAFALNKQAINEAIYDGAGILADSIFPPGLQFSSQIDRAIVKYPYDVRRAEQSMADAGYTRGADGIFTHPTLGRFTAELRTNASDQFETEMHVVGDMWRRAGFDFTEAITPQALVQDGQTRTMFSGVYIFGAGGWESALRGYTSQTIPTADNRWIGGNRGAWRDAEWDQLVLAYDATLDPTQRAEVAAQMAYRYSSELPAIPLEFDPNVLAFVKELKGPRGGPRDATVWNVHEWELQ